MESLTVLAAHTKGRDCPTAYLVAVDEALASPYSRGVDLINQGRVCGIRGVQQELLGREPSDNVEHSCPADWTAAF